MKRSKFLLIGIQMILFLNILLAPIEATAKELNVSARNAIALDCNSKLVMFEKNSEMITSIASTTKIMTSLIALKYGNLDRKVEISARAAGIRGSTVGYKKGEQIALRELLYGLMLRSGNDAAIAIAEGVSGSVEKFVKLMNEQAVEIGLSNSHFAVPHGLDDNEHYSTAYDLALITVKAKENKLFNEIVSTKDIDSSRYGFSRSYHNINKILWLLPEADGVKTGFTGDAGKCLVTTVKYQGKSIVIVVLNCYERWKETKRIFEYICNNYQYKKIYSKGDIVSDINVVGKRNSINLACSNDIEIPMRNDMSYDVKIVKPDKVCVPIKKGDKIGRICIYQNENLYYSDSLFAKENITNKKGIINILKKHS